MRSIERRICIIIAILICLLSICGGVAESLAGDQQLNAYYTLMTLALTNGEYEKALGYADSCLEMEQMLNDTLLADIWLKKGYALMYLSRFDEAINALDSCLEVMPDASEALLLKMQTYVVMGEKEKAMEQAEAYYTQYPEQIEVFATLGGLYAASGDYTGAIESYTRYIDNADDVNASAYEMRGQYLLQSGKYVEATADLTEAINALGEDAGARVYYLRAVAQMQTGENENAIDDLSVCVEYLESQETEDGTYAEQIDSDVLNSRYYRGIAAMQIGKYDMAIEDFTDCIEKQLNEQYSRFWRGACYLDSGAYESALKDFEICTQDGVEVESCMYYTALCNMGIEDYEAAIDGFTQCIEKDIMSGQALYNRGMCYIQIGDTEQGQADLEQSVGETDEGLVNEDVEVPELSVVDAGESDGE